MFRYFLVVLHPGTICVQVPADPVPDERLHTIRLGGDKERVEPLLPGRLVRPVPGMCARAQRR